MKKYLFMTFLSLIFSMKASASDMFSLYLFQQETGVSEKRGFKSAIDLFEQYEDGTLDRIIKDYDKTKASSGIVNFRGIRMAVVFDPNGVLTFNVPSAGINNMVFGQAGYSQEQSFKELTDYLKANQDDLLKKILSSAVSNTPYDLVAGNPNSMMTMMANASFDRGGGNLFGNTGSSIIPSYSIHKHTFEGDSKDGLSLSLPLNYTHEFKEDGIALLFDVPLTYYEIEGSKSYAMQFGMGLKIPLSKVWDITPSARAGIIGSEDMLSGGVLYNVSVTSNLRVPVSSNLELGMANMFGFTKDLALKVSDYEIDYDLQNYVYKNGINAVYSFANKVKLGAAYNYVVFTGDDLYIDKYHEFSVGIMKQMAKQGALSDISLTASYIFDANRYEEFKLSFGVSF